MAATAISTMYQSIWELHPFSGRCVQALGRIRDSERVTAVLDHQLSEVVGDFRVKKMVRCSESPVDLHLARNVIPEGHSAAMVALRVGIGAGHLLPDTFPLIGRCATVDVA